MLTPDTIAELHRLNTYAARHHGPIVDLCHGWGALRSEYLECEAAAQARDTTGLRRELLDLANVATRWAEALGV